MQGRAILAGIVFGLLGFAGNWFNTPLFLNVDFLYGSFFVMLAILRFGWGAGLIAGLIAGSCTWIIWRHPYGWVIFTVEALVVGLGSKKKGAESLVLWDTLFWFCLGMPMVWGFYSIALKDTQTATLLIFLKQAVNGMFNALLASIVMLLLPSRWGGLILPRFQHIIFTSMVALVLMPSWFMVMLEMRRATFEQKGLLAESTLHYAEMCRKVTDSELQMHSKDVTLGLADSTRILQTIADQRLFSLYLSDSTNRLVYSNQSEKIKTGLYGLPDKWAQTLVCPGVYQWIPPTIKGRSNMQRWTESVFVAELPLLSNPVWKISVQSSFGYVYEQLQSASIRALSQMLLLMLLVPILAYVISRNMTRSLAFLAAHARNFVKSDEKNEAVVLPQTSIKEVSEVIENFGVMKENLGAHMRALKSLNADLKDRVAAAETQFKMMVHGHVAVMLLVDPVTGRILDANKAAAEYYGYSMEALREMHIFELDTSDSKQVKEKIDRIVLKKSDYVVVQQRKANGDVRWVEMYATSLVMNQQHYIFSIIHDITGRLENEKVLAKTVEEKGDLLNEVNHRVKNNLMAIQGLVLNEKQALERDPLRGLVSLESLNKQIQCLLEVHQLMSATDWAPLRLSDLCTRVLDEYTRAAPVSLRANIIESGVLVSPRQASAIALVINELALQKGSVPVRVTCQQVRNLIEFEYIDHGPGYNEDFLQTHVGNTGMLLMNKIAEHTLRGSIAFSNAEGARALLTIRTEEGGRT
jgi:PAS domain S-box-containing protein